MRRASTRLTLYCIVGYFLLMVIACFNLAAPGVNVALFVVCTVVALPPVLLGSRKIKIVGLACLLLAMALATQDYFAGREMRQKIRSAHAQMEKRSNESDHDCYEQR